MAVKGTSIEVKNNMPDIIKGLSGKQTDALADTIGGLLESALVDKIQSGSIGGPPLSESWAEHKGHSNPWYYTGRLEGAIKYEVKDGVVNIGIIDAGSYRDGENVATVAMKLEFGSDKIPARPLFRPVAEEEFPKVEKETLAFVKDMIKKGKIM
jgi:hypothetical protein